MERSKLHAAPYNPRQIDKKTLDDLCESLSTYGFVQPVVARREDGLVVGGHQRLAAFDKLVKGGLPAKSVPVIFVTGLSDKEAKKLNLTLNKVQGTWDYDKLPAIIEELVVAPPGIPLDKVPEQIDLGVAGFSNEEVKELLDLASVGSLGAVEPFEKLVKGERMVSFRMPEAPAAEVEQILKEFGADSYDKRGAALLLALKKAKQAEEEAQRSASKPV